MKKTAIILGVFLVAVFFICGFFSIDVFAQSDPSISSGADTFGLQGIQDKTILSSTDIRVIIARIINVALGLLGVVTFGLVLYAGFVIMTAGGNEEKVAEGKKILINAVIGLAIILSAYAIVSFIITRLSQATGTGSSNGNAGGGVTRQTFVGSGALGSIIRDHYPLRDQIGVPRNSRISVTFREPIDPSSIINNNPRTDTNGSISFGNCISPPTGQILDWQNDCDQVNANVKIYPTGANSTEAIPAAVVSVPDGQDGHYYTFVFVPLSPMGNDSNPINYTVDLAGGIKKADGVTSAFVSSTDGYYSWQFETATVFDYVPPTVVRVYPESDAQNIPRNSIIQIGFSEAMDPSTVQGLNNPGSSFINFVFGNQNVTGNWRVTNGYSTAEFVSDQPCGERNSCGEVMYCLPESPVLCQANPHSPECEVMIRTAQLLNCPANQQGCLAGTNTSQSGQTNSFASVPLTGVTDMSGNSLDGNGWIGGRTIGSIGVPNGKPGLPSNPRTLDSSENLADNSFWYFSVGSRIDNTPPYITSISPSVDAEHVSGNIPVSINFSRLIWEQTLGGVSIEEHGLSEPMPFWYRAHTTVDGGQTIVNLDHRVFGPNGDDAFYYPTVSSTVKSVTQNCLYPGRGPNTPNESCSYTVDPVTREVTESQCVSVSTEPDADSGCPNTAGVEEAQSSISDCKNKLQALE